MARLSVFSLLLLTVFICQILSIHALLRIRPRRRTTPISIQYPVIEQLVSDSIEHNSEGSEEKSSEEKLENSASKENHKTNKDPNREWDDCGNPCGETCESLIDLLREGEDAEMVCHGTCQPGWYCRKGLYRRADNNKCVTPMGCLAYRVEVFTLKPNQ